jgi:spore germination protein PC
MQSYNEPAYSPQQVWMAWSQRVQQLHIRLEAQQAAIDSLSKQVESLSERLKSAETKPQYHIDRMEYHFDQLKVEKLDGTLNIGMTPPSEEKMKEIGQLVIPGAPSPAAVPPASAFTSDNGALPLGDVNDQALSGPNQFPSAFASGAPDATMPGPPYPEIRRDIDFYLNTRAPVILSQLEASYGITLDPFHRKLIVEDIRKQMSPRIQYYINVALPKGKTNDQNPPQITDELKSDIIQKTTRDIDAALQSYVASLASQSTNKNE